MRLRYTTPRSVLVIILSVAGGLPGVDSATATQGLSQIIDRLQVKYARTKSLAADFTQVYRAPGSKSLWEDGRLVFSRPRRMRWEYETPEKKLLISNGKHLFFYIPGDRQVVRSKVTEASDLRAAFAFMLGEFDIRRHFSSIELTRLESPLDAGNLVLRFIPRKPHPNFAELIIEVIPPSLQLRRITVREAGGGRSDFLLTKVRENLPVDEALFSFVPPPGVEIVEEPN
ncbi:MAG: outer membrane lipoprotein chaperone LolA [Acidobacteria bacterium]|nr:outer membrane lipoprotein chaperone LolA [Acidobacteriota bacterium]